ncbi:MULTISPECIES: hypothetical protein [Pseudanabaena]|uniref:hypothetical protein n=1 Tax=Pseudanabaena TaxID=1152 RepID=UPI00247B1609|nr:MULTISPECIES: hypothetical protein [Pseudanabaena]MEA5489809.1 hypothetical protein [Pseudanabaena sp. CCNP1317]WGS71056.1 hypothetical protein OA858_15180 [Pseudanabaena galeata CCNP1313]
MTNVLVPIPESIAAADCVKTKAKPKKRMAAQSAAILFLGFMSSYTWRQLYEPYFWELKTKPSKG